jgi:hypothetical protein
MKQGSYTMTRIYGLIYEYMPAVATISLAVVSYLKLFIDWLTVVSLLIGIGYAIWRWYVDYQKEAKRKK